MQVPCEHMGSAFALLDQHGILRLGEEYNADGSVLLQVDVPHAALNKMQADLLNATSGQVELTDSSREMH